MANKGLVRGAQDVTTSLSITQSATTLIVLNNGKKGEDRMAVKRIVTNVATAEAGDAQKFYGDILGLERLMDMGWIVTYGNGGQTSPQISFASEGGSGTPVPDMSIEVDNFEEVRQRVLEAKMPIEYGPVQEPWGLRRFYVRDPFGRLINILQHD